MQSKTMFFDNSNRPWPTESEAKTADDRLIAWGIIGDFAALENTMRERLQGQQPMVPLEDLILGIRHIYKNRIRAVQAKGETNVGHDGAVDGGNPPRNVGSNASEGLGESAEALEGKEAG
jgi:hypothetical protein